MERASRIASEQPTGSDEHLAAADVVSELKQLYEGIEAAVRLGVRDPGRLRPLFDEINLIDLPVRASR